MNEKDEFLVRLGGPKQYKKRLDELFRQRRLLSLEIRELVNTAYETDPVVRDFTDAELSRKWHKAIFQLHIVGESECDKSPYGMHAVSNAHQHHYECVWCARHVVDHTTELEEI